MAVWRSGEWLLLATVIGCGACGGGGGDDGVADARTVDARPLGTPDAPSPDAFVIVPVGSDVTGEIHLYDDPLGDAVLGELRSGVKIVRPAEAPACVIVLEPSTVVLHGAGTLTVGGSIVGSAGGPTETIVPHLDRDQYVSFGPVFATGTAAVAEVSLAGDATFPAIPKQSFAVPPATRVPLLKPEEPPPDPVIPEFKKLTIPGSAPFEIAWTKPDGWEAPQQLFVILRNVCGPPCPAVATVYCSFPIAAGNGVVPASVLGYLMSQVGHPLQGGLAIGAGRLVEVKGDGYVYVLEMVQPNLSTMPSLYNIALVIE